MYSKGLVVLAVMLLFGQMCMVWADEVDKPEGSDDVEMLNYEKRNDAYHFSGQVAADIPFLCKRLAGKKGKRDIGAYEIYEKRGDSGDLAVWRGTFWLSGIKEACKCLGYPILTKRADDYEEGSDDMGMLNHEKRSPVGSYTSGNSVSVTFRAVCINLQNGKRDVEEYVVYEKRSKPEDRATFFGSFKVDKIRPACRCLGYKV